MDSFIASLNQWGGGFVNMAWAMFWQSSLLILLLLGLDYGLQHRIRASVRHALWLVVLLKLCLPPTFALPTSPVWWLPKTAAPGIRVVAGNYRTTFDQDSTRLLPAPLPQPTPAPRPAITVAAGWLVLSTVASSVLLLWMLVRWSQIRRRVSGGATSVRLNQLARESQSLASLNYDVPIRLVSSDMSPAVCGLFRPAILLPQSLADQFSDEELRAVLVHEMIHLRRRDVWVNFAQALLQIIYWWHPLVWLANARLRAVREEAVDDAVWVALGEEADAYAPTLLEVAKLALPKPRVSLGLLGILESRHALSRRIERLLEVRPPRQAGMTLASLLGILAFTAVAVPMGDSPAPADDLLTAPDPILTLTVNPEVFIKNIRAEASLYEYAATDSYTNILLGILHREGVDFGRPGSFRFDPKTGDLTTQSVPDQLEIFRRVIEQLNRADGQCVLPLNLAGFHRRAVLIDGQIFAMSTRDFQALTNDFAFQSATTGAGNSLTGTIAADQFVAFNQRLKALGLTPFQRPRIQTAHGTTAQIYVGSSINGVIINGVELDCRPTVGDGQIGLAFRGEIKGNLAADGKTLTGVADHKMSGNVQTENQGGIVVCASNPDSSKDKNFVMVLSVQLVTNQAPALAHEAVAAVANRDNASIVRAVEANQGASAASPRPVNPRIQVHMKARFLEVPATSSFSDAIYANTNILKAGMVGILSRKNAQDMLRTLEQRAGVNTLAEPEMTTTSGRQTQMRATSIISIVTGETNLINSTGSNVITALQTQLETGPVLDATARVLPDGATIELKATASLTDFLGYDEPPTNAAAAVTTANGTQLPVVLPCYSVRQGSASVKIWDNQTVLLGKLARQFYDGGKAVPAEPEYFVKTKKSRGQPDAEDSEVLVFITVTMVDEAGNRVHSDDTPPFGGDTVPPQIPTSVVGPLGR
jgi:beta-lactamase regulating signal transducer with metallopeptidase domain